MKVIIKVFTPSKEHDGYDLDTIVEHDVLRNPEVVGLGIPIERCQYEEWDKALKVYLMDYPARVDADQKFSIIYLIDNDGAENNPKGYTLLFADKDKGEILWTNPNIKVTEEVS